MASSRSRGSARLLRPHAQLVLTRWLGAGNERVYPGREGWLFYRQDVEYVTGPGFLEPRRSNAGSRPRPSGPSRRSRIRDRRCCNSSAIWTRAASRSSSMPTPVKPTIHPEMLALATAQARRPVQNASYRVVHR